MDMRVQSKLEEIGCQFDRGISPLLWTGGVVVPNNPEHPLLWQEVKNHEPRKTQRPRGSEARQGERPPGRQRQAYGPWTPSPYPKGFSASGLPIYSEQLAHVCNEYPGTRVWHQDEGFWLLSQSRLLDDCDRRALFLTSVPYDMNLPITSWEFWDRTIGIEWIGTRHTNFPFGSICSFEPREGVPWGLRNLVTFLDLYTLWSVKHLHLKQIGRWPGRQSIPFAYERLLELGDDEFCGCPLDTGLPYKDCCKDKDKTLDFLREAISYTMQMGGGTRSVPTEIIEFARTRQNPPPVKKFI